MIQFARSVALRVAGALSVSLLSVAGTAAWSKRGGYNIIWDDFKQGFTAVSAAARGKCVRITLPIVAAARLAGFAGVIC